jgi:hypothetical protein
LPSIRNEESSAGALFGGETSGGCDDNVAVEADPIRAGDEGTLDNFFSLPRSKVQTQFSYSPYIPSSFLYMTLRIVGSY